MKTFIQNGIKKFKQDVLSKVIYDVTMSLLCALGIFLLSLLIPDYTSFSQFISQELIIKYYWLIIAMLLIVLFSILGVYLIFRTKYNSLEEDNFTDELTGLKNHKALKQFLDIQLRDLDKRTHEIASIILIDIDDFKQFNSLHGYNVSDQILQKLGELLANDKRATDETFRFYNRGDEFLIFAKETSANAAYQAAERKRKLIQKASFLIDGVTHNITVSCGVTEFKHKADDYQSFTDRAIKALMEAKKISNKNCTKLFV